MPHHVASDQGLHCLLTGFSIKNRIKQQNRPDTPKMTYGLVQQITVEESGKMVSTEIVATSLNISYIFLYFSELYINIIALALVGLFVGCSLIPTFKGLLLGAL